MSASSFWPFPLMFPVLPFVLLVMGMGYLTYRQETRRKERLKAFADADGLTFDPEKSPIAVPDASRGLFLPMVSTKNFLIGQRHGAEVFACDFKLGSGRGSSWYTMLAVRGGLDLTRFDLRQWNAMSHNGWTFLVPLKYWASRFDPPQIAWMWDSMTAAVLPPQMRRG